MGLQILKFVVRYMSVAALIHNQGNLLICVLVKLQRFLELSGSYSDMGHLVQRFNHYIPTASIMYR